MAEKERTLDNFTKEKKEWQRKVEVEIAQPYGVFAVGVVA